MKQLHPNLKVLISVGGASAANTANFSAAAATPAGRSELAASCIDTFINGNLAPGVSAAGLFDGIDLDWEFPTAADKENFTALRALAFRRHPHNKRRSHLSNSCYSDSGGVHRKS